MAGLAGCGSPPSSEAVLSANGAGGLSDRAGLGDPTATTVALADPDVTTVAGRASTTRPSPTTTRVPAVAPQTTVPSPTVTYPYPYPTTTTLAPGQQPRPFVPPVPTNPGEWTFERNGLHARVRMTPTQPNLGDTVQFDVETWTTLPGARCCSFSMMYAQEVIYSRQPGLGPCQSTIPRQDRFSYHITYPTMVPVPGVPLKVSTMLFVATTWDPCLGPPTSQPESVEFTMPIVVKLPNV